MRTAPPRIVKWGARLFLKLIGWELYGDFTNIPKCVVIAQHTSNWDGFIGIAGALGLGIYPHWLGKKELFRFPFGYFIKLAGGIPLDRSLRHNLVEQAIEQLNATDKLIIGIAPEGTRKPTTHWRSGFYYIALGANVPIVVALFDYENKRIGHLPPIYLTGDVEQDLATIREAFAESRPRHPENAAPIEFATKQEVQPPAIS